jgi:hypothetical protein
MLEPIGVVAQTPCDVVANLNLHVEVAAVMQFKAHHIFHDPVKPLSIADQATHRDA